MTRQWRRSSRLAGLLLAGLAWLAPAWATAGALERMRSSAVINLGYQADAAPFSSRQGARVDGYSIELCRQLAGILQGALGLGELQVNFQALAQDAWPAALQSGQVDLYCTPAPASARLRGLVSFSVPVYTGGLGVLVAQDAPTSLLAVLNGEAAHSGPTWRATLNRGLAKHSFAVVEGGVGETWVRDKLNQLGVIATVITVASYGEGVQLVREGRADAFFSERMLLKQLVSQAADGARLQVLERIFEFVPVSLGLARGDEDLRLQVDVALSELYRSGALLQSYRQYLGEPGETASLLFKVYPLPQDH